MALKSIPVQIPPVGSLEEVQQVMSKTLQDILNQLSMQFPPTQYGGKRISGVGAPQEMDDTVTLRYLLGQRYLTSAGLSNSTAVVISTSTSPSAASQLNDA